ncbi:MAG: hypothetical protein FE038_02080 [Thermoplasmata archaeon]|nr:MAG: hypothetical protein FE038_02080 [Thermoplasmata archaeon]
MERETHTITTPVGKQKIELLSWITGKEKRELRNVFLKRMNFKMSGAEAQTDQIDGSVIEEAENKAIEIVVVSIDGSKEKILEKVLSMRDKDYDFVITEINKVTGGTSFFA